MRNCIVVGPLILVTAALAVEDPPVFSGPQAGEALSPVKVRGVLGPRAGEEFDVLEQAGAGPVLLVFMHQFTRPSVALTRTLLNFAAKRKAPHVTAGLIFLTDDLTAATAQLKRAQHALPGDIPVAISLEGPEGPGAYGLNRNVALTVLVGCNGKVLANFALIQPSVEADALRVARAVHQAAGGQGEAPTRKDLDLPARTDRMANEQLDTLLRQVIQKNKTPEQVAQAASAVDKYLESHPPARGDLFNRLQRIILAGRLENYGSPEAQQVLKKWHDQLGKEPPQTEGDRR